MHVGGIYPAPVSHHPCFNFVNYTDSRDTKRLPLTLHVTTWRMHILHATSQQHHCIAFRYANHHCDVFFSLNAHNKYSAHKTKNTKKQKRSMRCFFVRTKEYLRITFNLNITVYMPLTHPYITYNFPLNKTGNLLLLVYTHIGLTL